MNSSVRRGHGPGLFDVWLRGQWLRELHICVLSVCVCVLVKRVWGVVQVAHAGRAELRLLGNGLTREPWPDWSCIGSISAQWS